MLDDLLELLHADLFLPGKKRDHILVGAFKILVDRFLHKVFPVILFADQRKVLVGLSESLVADIAFVLKVSNDRTHRVVVGLGVRKLLDNLFDECLLEVPKNPHDLFFLVGQFIHMPIFEVKIKLIF